MAKPYREDSPRVGNHAKDRPLSEVERQAEQEYLLKLRSASVITELRQQGYRVNLRRERDFRGLEVLPDPVHYPGGFIGWKVR